jgi:hypothetical protein
MSANGHRELIVYVPARLDGAAAGWVTRQLVGAPYELGLLDFSEVRRCSASAVAQIITALTQGPCPPVVLRGLTSDCHKLVRDCGVPADLRVISDPASAISGAA